MPAALTDWRIEIGLEAAVRGQGADPEALAHRRPQLLVAAGAAVHEAQGLLRPLVLYRELDVVGRDDAGLDLDAGRLACGACVAGRLARARVLVALACTIGPALEDRVGEVLPKDPARALALSGAGSAAVEALAALACERFRASGAARGLRGSVQCWPGAPHWPAATAQPQIFDLVDPARGQDAIRLLSSAVMWPLKSLSLVLGLTPEPVAHEHECDSCPLASTCRFRDLRSTAAGSAGVPDTAVARGPVTP